MKLLVMIPLMFVGLSLTNVFSEKKVTTATVTTASVEELTDATFSKAIKSGVVVVDFYAVWCKPCKLIAPILEEIATEKGKAVKICKLDTDKNPTNSSKYGIQYLPTIIIFKNGVQKEKLVGMQTKESLLTAINNASL